MASPFVVSFKLTGDSSGAVRAADEERRALDALRTAFTKTGESASASRTALDAGLGIRPDNDNSQARAADIAAYGRELDALRAKFNPLYAAEQRQAQAVAEIQRAHRVGAISAGEMTQAIEREKVAFDQLTASMQNNRGAGAATANAGSFQSANIAAQFQDIGVTAGMGMSPLTIGLQQGTQLSAVLEQLRGQGQSTGAALATAFASIVSPVSLITIGAVAATAAVIQFGSAVFNAGETAEDALEKHLDWLDKVLAGYGDAADKAKSAAEAAQALPRAAIESELTAQAESDLDRFMDKLRRVREASLGLLNPQYIEAYLPFGERGPVGKIAAEIAELQANLDPSNLDAFVTRLTEIKNGDYPEEVRQVTEHFLQLMNEVRAANAQLSGTTTALRELQAIGPINIHIGATGDLVAAGIDRIRQMAPDLRTEYEKVAEELENVRAHAAGLPEALARPMVLAAEYEYNRTIGALDQQEAARQATRAAGRAKEVSDYERAIEAVREKTAAQQIESNVIGLSTFAAERLRVQTELENAARRDAIGLSPQRIGEIDREAAAQARLAAQVEQTNGIYSAGKEVFTTLFGGLSQAAADGIVTLEELGDTATSVLDRIRDRAVGMLADGIWDMIFGAVLGVATGGASGGPFGRAGSFSIGDVASYDVGTDFHPGGPARIHQGEIVNLPRGTQVITARKSAELLGGSGGSQFVFAPQTSITVEGGGADASASFQRALDQRDQTMAAMFEEKVLAVLENPSRRAT